MVESPVVEPGLLARFPELRTFAAQGLDDPHATARLNFSPRGMHVQVLSPHGAWYIDPFNAEGGVYHTSYRRSDLGMLRAFTCHTPDAAPPDVGLLRADEEAPAPDGDGAPQMVTGATLRTFRLAVCTTGEYTLFHGGTVAGGLAAVVTALNRVTGVYEQEFAIRMVLVAGNDQLIFTNPSTDPFTNPGSADQCNQQAQARINQVIGFANYDVGHVFHRGGNGGLAGGIGTVCGTIKAQGYSSLEPPVNDPFVIDYVCHELGHQFGARHSFNNCGFGAGDDPNIAHEPGSGSTIMSYAGLCGSNDLQPNSDPQFISLNLEQVNAYIAAQTCDLETATGNGEPTVNAGPDRTIPQGTPFALTASATDPDGDPLTYTWEQRNGGPPVPLTAFVDNGSAPIARVYPPSSSNTRFMPRYQNLLAGNFPLGETLPSTNRTMNWRVVVRDNRVGGTGLSHDDVAITVRTAAGPFIVTQPAAGATWRALSPRTVQWNVAGTIGNGVNCQSVDILLSLDGGQTFPITLAQGTPNDGQEQVIIPNLSGLPASAARIMVRAADNIFFNISPGSFTLLPGSEGVLLESVSALPVDDTLMNGNGNGKAEPGELAVQVGWRLANAGATAATGATATLTSLTPTASVVASSVEYPALAAQGGQADPLSPFVVRIDDAHPCGEPVALRFAWTSGGFSGEFDVSLATGTPGGPGERLRFRYVNPPVVVPDGVPSGITVPIEISGVFGAITNVQVSLDGTSCNTNAASTTVGLSHEWVGDMLIRLTSPQGTTVTLIDGRGSSGNNFCNTRFDDSAATSITTITAAQNPYTGSFRPEQPLSAFNGQQPNGQWVLYLQDYVGVDPGTLRQFSVWVQGLDAPVCAPPAPCWVADFDGGGGVDDLDIAAFFAAFESGQFGADVNGDDAIDDLDITVFFAAFESGC